MKSNLYIILYLLSNIFRTFNVYLFYETFLTGGEKKKIKGYSYGLFYLVISMEYVFFDIPILTLLLNIVGLLALTFLYPSSYKKRVLGAGFILALLLAAESIVMALTGYLAFPFTRKGYYSSLTGVVCIPIVLFLLLIVYRKFVRHRGDIAIPVSYWIMVIIVPISCIYMIVLGFSIANIQTWQIVSNVTIMFAITLSVFQLYEKQIEFFRTENRRNMLEAQNEYYHKQLVVYQEMTTATRSVRHDMKNHLLSIAALAEKKDCDAVGQYVQDLQELMYSLYTHVTTGNIVFDSILNSKMLQAQEKGLVTDFKIAIPDELNMDEVDCTILFGNLLDNAIENAKEEIVLHVRYDRGRLIVCCENEFQGERIHNGELFETTKTDAGNHGYGLQNIRRIVKKYDGMFALSDDADRFKVDIIMYL